MRSVYLLEANNITKQFANGAGPPQPILDSVSVQFSKGEFTAIMGPSGSGKSTLLYALSSMDELTSGTVRFDGLSYNGQTERQLADLRLKKMGFIFQHMHLLKNLSILDNILLPAYRAKTGPRGELNTRAANLMRRAGIEGLEQREITQVSGGQLQRAAICRALINRPAVVFGDEPTGALNSESADQIMSIIQDIHLSGTTVILVTHDTRVAARAERVLYLLDGRLAGELRLGLYAGESAQREQQLSRWLACLASDIKNK
ncbi:ABC transporter ATP-binding protein [Paenibacillus sp. CN-4]|uniref:ABC transporter ATP-binding protein n=1 Tax=Paenibacillus nanchangensis TaxID=3348343 RepID=UPI00397A9163